MEISGLHPTDVLLSEDASSFFTNNFIVPAVTSAANMLLLLAQLVLHPCNAVLHGYPNQRHGNKPSQTRLANKETTL